MMRSRKEIKDHVQKLYKLEDKHERAFKLFVTQIELELDIRDYLEVIARHLASNEVAALQKSVDRNQRA